MARALAWFLAASLVGATGCIPKTTVTPMGPVERPAVEHPSAAVPGFMRGVNLGNGLDAPSEGAWGVVLGEGHFRTAAAAGLDHVRLPVRWSAHALPGAPYTVSETFFARVDWAVDQALANGLSVIVDFHHYHELTDDPEPHVERYLAIWEQIAARYAARPPEVAFELLNEPCHELNSRRWNELSARALEVVRRTNPDRVVFVDSYFWASADYLGSLELPDDPAVVGSFHMYQPILFTHQGAPWMEPEYSTTGVVFPGPPAAPVTPTPAARKVDWVSDWFDAYNRMPAATNPGGPKTVFEHFGKAEAFVKRTGHRLYLGEFGAIDFADPTSRTNYLRLVRQEAERRGIGWAVWDDGGNNRAMYPEDGRWVEPVRAALFED